MIVASYNAEYSISRCERIVQMDSGIIGLMVISWGAIFLIIQRTEVKKRRGVGMFLALIGLIIIWYIISRQVWGEGIVGFLIAAFLNFLFYVLIGRYNPVGSSDNIRVLGMDD